MCNKKLEKAENGSSNFFLKISYPFAMFHVYIKQPWTAAKSATMVYSAILAHFELGKPNSNI